MTMNKKEVEKLFIYLTPHIEKKYEEEINMAMDAFLEEEFDFGQLERFLEYVLDKVKEDEYDRLFDEVNARLLRF